MSGLSAHVARTLTAIEALAQGRVAEAHTIVLDLLADSETPLRRGQCRYCACSDDHSCAIMVVPGPEFEPGFVRCQWADDEHTVCTNVRCLERHNREHPIALARMVIVP